MKYVYIVWSIPDYIGIDIEEIFDNEDAAVKLVKEHNATSPDWDQWEYDKYEVKSN